MKPHKSILLLPALLAVQSVFAQNNPLTLSDSYPSTTKKLKLLITRRVRLLPVKRILAQKYITLMGKITPQPTSN